MNRLASSRVLNAMRKLAYVPLTAAAQDAMAQQQPPMDPAMAGGQPPMDPAMMQGGGMPPMPPMDPSMMGGAMPPEDPAAQMASGAPVIDPQSGLPIDPSTGMFTNTPPAGAPTDSGVEGGLGEAMPGFEAFIDKYEKTADRQDKLNKRILHDLSGTRTDIQGVRREIQQLNDDQDTLLARLENVLNLLERMLGGAPAQPTQQPGEQSARGF